MSNEQKEKTFDHWFKILTVIAISVSGWFFNRLAERFDKFDESIQEIRIDHRELKTTVIDLKEDFKELKQKI